ncbi:MAG: hypothetical protein IPP58_14470 [Holophagaceae bacterium]|uniref:Uncharacterized protein n=1 Tax=Candidatus Geothrix skivensis TaxID=2954439 RepID=A0A9D7SHB0_9BACT|nr:hypothetical protein [Candidatus Geothrix skivensis]
MSLFILINRAVDQLSRLGKAMAEGLHMVLHAGTVTHRGTAALTPIPSVAPAQVPRVPRLAKRWRA